MSDVHAPFSRADLTSTGHAVSDVVEMMERAFFAGGWSRVTTLLTHRPPAATDEKLLRERLFSMPTKGWSCWDLSVALVSLLRERGIDAGVTAAFGVEPGAPSEPHSLVRVRDEDGSTFLSDPYFGVGAVRLRKGWLSFTAEANIVADPYGPQTWYRLRHKGYRRTYGYNVLPGTLTGEQLSAMCWQALDYGSEVRHIRGLGGGSLWRVIEQDHRQQRGELRRWPHASVICEAEVVEGSFWEFVAAVESSGVKARAEALDYLFNSAPLPDHLLTTADGALPSSERMVA